MANDPWAGITNIGAIDQKLYKQPDPKPSPQSPAVKKQPIKPAAKTQKFPAPTDKPNDLPEKRAIRTRHPFDIYEDQYIDLRNLSLQMQMKGEKCSMSQMVREALDKYIPAKKRESNNF